MKIYISKIKKPHIKNAVVLDEDKIAVETIEFCCRKMAKDVLEKRSFVTEHAFRFQSANFKEQFLNFCFHCGAQVTIIQDT